MRHLLCGGRDEVRGKRPDAGGDIDCHVSPFRGRRFKEMLLRILQRAVNPARRDPALEPIAFAFEHGDVGLLEEPVDRGVGEDTVGEPLAPFLDVAVGGQHESCAVLASIDQIEHLFGIRELAGLERHVLPDDDLRLLVARGRQGRSGQDARRGFRGRGG